MGRPKKHEQEVKVGCTIYVPPGVKDYFKEHKKDLWEDKKKISRKVIEMMRQSIREHKKKQQGLNSHDS